MDCTVVNDGDSIKIENRFGAPDDFQLSTNIYIEESQNVRLTIEFVDYGADLLQDNSVARTNIEAHIDYGNNVLSPMTIMNCKDDCLKGVFIGNLDINHPNPKSGLFKLVLNIHAFTQDWF